MQGNQWHNPITNRMDPNGPGNPNGVPATREILRIGNSDTLRRDSAMERRKTIIAPVTCVSQNADNLVVSVGVSDIEFDSVVPPGTLYSANIIAEITFGVAGGRQVVEVDAKSGVQLSLTADSLEVTAKLENWENPGSPRSVRVAASVGIGGRAARAFPTRTYPIQAVPAGGGVNFRIPPYAYSLMLFGDAGLFVPGAGSVLVTGSNGSVGYSGGAILANVQANQVAEANITDGYKLPNGAATVTVFNASSDPLNVSPMFALSI